MGSFFDTLRTSIDAGTVIVLAGMGELLGERVGVLNLGLEGMIAIGAVAAVIGADHGLSPVEAFAIAMAAGAMCGVIFGIVTSVVRANQVLAGLAFVLLGVGVSNELGSSYSGVPVEATFSAWPIPYLHELPRVGDALFNHDPIVYLAYLVLPAVTAWMLFRTRHGLNLRAIGENPGAADAAGLNVTATRLGYSTVGGALAGAGGAYLVLSFTPAWTQNVAGGSGWVALALVIFAYWRPWRLVFGALLFGAMVSFGFLAQTKNWGLPAPLLSMMPYVVTLVLIVLPALLPGVRLRRNGAAPAALAIPYFREQR